MNGNLNPESVSTSIYKIRGYQVMLDHDLANLYGVATKNLNKAVKRNIERFPLDFMFQLSPVEHEVLRFQIGTLKRGAHRKYFPLAFTQEGIAMLSGILRSQRAVQVNIAIMRAFVRLRHAVSQNRDLARRVEKIEGRIGLMETDVRLMLYDIRDLKKPLEIPPRPQPHVKGFEKAQDSILPPSKRAGRQEVRFLRHRP